MFYKRFTIGLIIRVSLLLVNLITIAIIFGKADLFFNHIILGTILVGQVIDLARFVHRTNRDLAKWLTAIQNSDFTVHFSTADKDQSFRTLHQAFNTITNTYKQVKIEKEVQFQYLQQIVKHISAGVISLEENNKVALMNQPAMDMLGISWFNYWHHIGLANPVFVKEVELLQDGQSKLLEVPVQDEIRRLSVQVSSMILIDKEYKIITFQDIENEINRNEIEAWNKLIRILTHEIMNSVTPISSLSETMLLMIKNGEEKAKTTQQISNENIQDIAFSLKTIQKRSDGLLHFVEDYRKLTRVPTPHLELVSVTELFNSVKQLMLGEIQKYRADLNINIKTNVEILADFTLMEQVLINLITNSLQASAMQATPKISLAAFTENNRKVIEVADNGEGIDEDKLDNIFVPFFSTKEKGSGIGLSLSKNIISMHDGQIKVSSQKAMGTTFSLIFK